MVLRNEKYVIVVRQAYQDIVSSSVGNPGEVHKRTARCCEPCEDSPNSLGRIDKHKINFVHKQLHPSMIGVVDLLESSKDVGQSGMISPWADTSILQDANINKYPNIKYDLFNFICDEFPDTALTFDCDNIEDFNFSDPFSFSCWQSFD